MEKLCLADFDDTLILTDSLMTIFAGEKWFFSPALFTAGVRLFLCRLTRRGESEARSAFNKKLLLNYAELSDAAKEQYILSLKEKINTELTNRIRSEGYDRIMILSASEGDLIRSVISDSFEDYEVIANSIPSNCLTSRDKLSAGSPGHEEIFRTCYGPEKIHRLSEVLPDYSDYRITVYTDSYSDQPLIEIADEAYLVKGMQIDQIKP